MTLIFPICLRLSVIKQMANLSEAVSVDIHEISKTVGMGGRINCKFMRSGPAHGGSCFLKRTRAVVDSIAVVPGVAVVSPSGKYGAGR